MNKSPYKNSSVLITGGAGFIGSHLAEKLVAHKARVVVLDNLSTGSLKNITHLTHSIEFIHGDITLPATYTLLSTKGYDVIFHCAALTSVPESFEHPLHYYATNVTGTALLLDYARRSGSKRVLFSSSSAVYGTQTHACSENMQCVPLSPYGYSKLLGEQLCTLYAHCYGLHTLSLRYFNVYGKRQNSAGPYASFAAKARKALENNQPITIFGDGSQTRDFVPVEKVVEANMRLALLPPEACTGTCSNVATGRSTSIRSFIDELRTAFPDYTSTITYAPPRTGDIAHSAADCSHYESLVSQTRFI